MPPASAAPAPANPDRSADQDDLTYNEQLNAVDRYWKFKMALQIAMIFASIIGISCLAWALATANKLHTDWGYGSEGSWALPWGLITFSISLVWCAVCIARLVLAKHPVHPGVRVTMDLLLWLGFLVTALFTLYALFALLDWGSDGDIGYSLGYSTSYGDYVLQNNNTWVWETSGSNSGVTYNRVCNGSSSYTNYEPLPFHNCAEMDAYVRQPRARRAYRRGHAVARLLTPLHPLRVGVRRLPPLPALKSEQGRGETGCRHRAEHGPERRRCAAAGHEARPHERRRVAAELPATVARSE
jgi:hypothetical protein